MYDSVVAEPSGGATENRRISDRPGVYLIVEADDVEEARRQVGQGHLAERPVLDQVTQCLGGLLKGEGPVTGGRDLAACDQRQDRGVRLCLRITPT